MELQHFSWIDFAIVLGLSLFGAYARILFECGTSRTRRVIIDFIIGSFAGLSCYFLVKSTDHITGSAELFCIALAGFCARDVLHFFVNVFFYRIKKFFTPNKDK